MGKQSSPGQEMGDAKEKARVEHIAGERTRDAFLSSDLLQTQAASASTLRVRRKLEGVTPKFTQGGQGWGRESESEKQS